ncbi:MAG: response regulator SirA [Candidatus Thorarchaeota archaeon]|nr:MAG: response regulator SirA [Candidatus Thorarchaeota archaeon]
MPNYTVARELDASGMRCPMPVLEMKKAITQIKVGEVVKVIATDVGTKKDFPAWAERTGNEILEMKEESNRIIWFIKRLK